MAAAFFNALLMRRGFAGIQSPRKPDGLSHGIFECLIVEASSHAQNHLSVLADRYTERCRGVFDCKLLSTTTSERLLPFVIAFQFSWN